MIGQPYIVTTNDVARGIQWLAAELLGNATLWQQLVTLNQLAPPYLSNNPSDVYGPVIATWIAPQAISAGASQIPVANLPKSVTDIYLTGVNAAGFVGEPASVASYHGTMLTLGTPLNFSFYGGSTGQAFSNYNLGSTSVLLPGSIIYAPSTALASSTVLSQGVQTMQSIGSDLALPISFTDGDLTVANSATTISQRMKTVLTTMMGSYTLYMNFGSQLFSALGAPPNQIKWAAMVRAALCELPEVQNVKNIVVNITGDQVILESCDVYLNTSSVPIKFFNETFTLQ